MKKCILSALAGAMAMLIAITVMASIHANKAQHPKNYEHIDYISNITSEECYVCGDNGDTPASVYWGEDNVGIINLNTFEMMRLEINRYDDHGMLIEYPVGVMLSCGIADMESDSYAHAYCFPDNAYASVQITGARYAIDRDMIQSRLCQKCLDSINGMWFKDQAPAEYAVISFEERSIRPLTNSYTRFMSGNFVVDCDYDETLDGNWDVEADRIGMVEGSSRFINTSATFNLSELESFFNTEISSITEVVAWIDRRAW